MNIKEAEAVVNNANITLQNNVTAAYKSYSSHNTKITHLKRFLQHL